MKLSIIIPLYNKGDYIERCLKSLINQNLSSNEYEIIIVDDGSTDSGRFIIQNYAEKCKNILIYNQENKGVSVARNKGLQLSTGNYVYFLDADDYLAENVLSQMIGLSIKNNLEILEFGSIEAEENEFPDSTSQFSNNVKVDVKDGLSYIVDYDFRNQAWRYIVKRDLLEKTGIKFIKDWMYEDTLFTASLFLKATRMAKINVEYHRYVVVPHSINTSKNQSHQQKMIDSTIVVIDQIQLLINDLDCSYVNYDKIVRRLKARQQSLVFSLMIRIFRHRIIKVEDLKNVLIHFNSIGIYPMDSNIDKSIRKGKASIALPIFNKKNLLLLALRFRRLVPFY